MEAEDRWDISQSHFLISIDTKQTKIYDDALSIDELPDGKYSVGIHVADVMAAKPKNYHIAKRRTSNSKSKQSATIRQACSLDPQTLRRAISVFIEYENNGKRSSTKPWIGRTLVQNRYAMTFESAQSILEHPELDDSFMRHPEEVQRRIRLTLLRLSCLSRGFQGWHWEMSMDIEPFECDLVPSFGMSSTCSGRRIVIELMSVASECVAERLIEAKKAIFSGPTEISREDFIKFFSFLRNVGIGIEIKLTSLIDVAQLIPVLKKNTPAYRVLFDKICTLMGAVRIHSGLTREPITDNFDIKPKVPFTSPLWRSADLYTHFLLAKHLDKHPGALDRAEHSVNDATDSADAESLSKKMQKEKRAALITHFKQKCIVHVPNNFIRDKSAIIIMVEKIGMHMAMSVRSKYRQMCVCSQTTNFKVIRIDFALMLSWPIIDDLIGEYIIQSSGMADLSKHHDLFSVFRVQISKECVITLFVPRVYVRILEALFRGSLFMPERKSSSILFVLNENCKSLAKKI